MALVIDDAERIIVGTTVLEELTEDAVMGLKPIGVAYGVGVIPCAYLAWKNEPDFETCAVGYRIAEYDPLLAKHDACFEEQPTMEVTFYGRK